MYLHDQNKSEKSSLNLNRLHKSPRLYFAPDVRTFFNNFMKQLTFYSFIVFIGPESII